MENVVKRQSSKFWKVSKEIWQKAALSSCHPSPLRVPLSMMDLYPHVMVSWAHMSLPYQMASQSVELLLYCSLTLFSTHWDRHRDSNWPHLSTVCRQCGLIVLKREPGRINHAVLINSNPYLWVTTKKQFLKLLL